MPDVISFQAAIEATKGEDRALLIGNGFSAQYFNYTDLLAKSGLELGTPIRNVFEILETVDFEAVVRSIEDAAIVERAYGNDAHSDELEADAQKGLFRDLCGLASVRSFDESPRCCVVG